MATNTFAPVKDGQIFYRFDGDPKAPVVLFSNSLGTTHRMWDPQVPTLSKRFHVLRYDNRGHGASSVIGGDYTIEMLGRDVLALLDHLEIESALYCGLSVGGIIGQWLALNAGGRFSKMVLSNTSAYIGTQETWNARIENVRKGGMRAISEATMARWFQDSFRAAHPDTVQRIRAEFEATPAAGYTSTCAAIRDNDLRGSVSRIHKQVLVISGTHDPACTLKDGQYLAQQIPGAQFVELNAAHLANIELPEQYDEALQKFLAP